MSSDPDGVFRSRAARWALITGRRTLIAAGVLGIVFVATLALLRIEPASGAREAATGLFGNGFVPGIITLVTVSLSVNQLILSRVFGSPGQFLDRLDENLSFRRRAGELAHRSNTPADPTRFLELVEGSMRARVNALRPYASDADDDDEFARYLDEMEDYCDRLRDESAESELMSIVVRTFDTRYALELRRTSGQLHERGDELPSEAVDDLETIFDLLKEVAVLRQFFKTIAIQQNLALLSRRVGVLGVVSLLVSVYMASDLGPALAAVAGLPAPLVASAAFAVAVAPVAVLVSYVLRLATISLHTLSVGPFVPPAETDSE